MVANAVHTMWFFCAVLQMSTWWECPNRRGQTAGVTANLFEGSLRPHKNNTHHTTSTPHNTPHHKHTTGAPQAHLHLQRRYRSTSFKWHEVCADTRRQHKFILHGASNLPINERTKAHAPWHEGQVRLLRTQRESRLNEWTLSESKEKKAIKKEEKAREKKKGVVN